MEGHYEGGGLKARGEASDNISEDEPGKVPPNYALHTPPITSGWGRVASAPFSKNSPTIFSSMFSAKGVSPSTESVGPRMAKPVKGVIGVFVPKRGSKVIARPFPKNLSVSVRSTKNPRKISLKMQN